VVSSFFGLATAAVGKVGRPFYKFFYASTELVIEENYVIKFHNFKKQKQLGK
jgi:hypothetical protein